MASLDGPHRPSGNCRSAGSTSWPAIAENGPTRSARGAVQPLGGLGAVSLGGILERRRERRVDSPQAHAFHWKGGEYSNLVRRVH